MLFFLLTCVCVRVRAGACGYMLLCGGDDVTTSLFRLRGGGGLKVLTVEGSPPADIITHGGYGNAKRVGHDISPNWGSMISLVDIGSGLWRV